MFRQEALDQLSSPEELDKLMYVTSPRLWLALVAVVGLLVAGLFWMIFTAIPSTVSTTGSLVAEGSRGSVQPVVFATLQEANEIKHGQAARVTVPSPQGDPHVLTASVASVNPFPIDEGGMLSVLHARGLARALASQQKIIEVRLALGRQHGVALAPGMLVTASITVDKQNPIHLVIP